MNPVVIIIAACVLIVVYYAGFLTGRKSLIEDRDRIVELTAKLEKGAASLEEALDKQSHEKERPH